MTRPPGAIRSGSWTAGALTASFVAPGNQWYSGTPASYRVTFAGLDKVKSLPATVPAGATQTIVVPVGATGVRVQAVGSTGLLGQAVRIG